MGVNWSVIKRVSDVGGQMGVNWSVVRRVRGCARVVTLKSIGVNQVSDGPRSTRSEMLGAQGVTVPV